MARRSSPPTWKSWPTRIRVTGGFVKGNVSFNGWDCKVKLAYEFARAVCTKPGARLVSESGA